MVESFWNGSEANSDGAGPTAGPNPGPAIPGQDFLNPAVYLTGGYVVVTPLHFDLTAREQLDALAAQDWGPLPT